MSFSVGDIISQTENFSLSPSAEIVMIWDWATRVSTARTYFGRFSAGAVFVAPAAYSDILGLYCTGIALEPYGPSVSGGGWQYAQATISFGMPEVQLNSEGAPADGGEEKLTVGGDSISLPTGNYKWTSGSFSGRSLDPNKDATPSKIIPSMIYSVSYKYKTEFDPIDLCEYVGKVNSEPFGTRGFPAETVLYLGADTNRSLAMGSGEQFWSVTHNFAIKAADTEGGTFNTLWDGTAYSEINSLDGDKIYETADLNSIFDL